MESLTGKTSEEVEIPKLAENGRNWKIYRAKIVEAAATDITDLAGWEPDNGSYDWECWDAILKWTFYTSVPISILRPIQKLDTAHEIFKYLAKRFCDNNPIPRANELQRAGTATVVEAPDNCPTSADAATEWHAHAEWNTEDLSTTEDVNNGNTGRTQDPRTNTEAPAEGTSTKCAEMTTVILKGVPHKMQNLLQDSLLLTPRPPIEGEPNGCKQEATDSMVTAGCTKGMVETAKPTDADVDSEKAPLGRDPAEMACRVDEGDEMERKPQLQLQEMKLLCREIIQCSGNTENNVPIADGLPLEGEWTICASGKTSNSNGDAHALNAAVEHADHAGQGVEPADVPNETDMLVTLSIELEDLSSSGIPHVYLGGTHWHACHTKGLGDRVDGSSCETDGARCQTDASRVSNRPEMAVVSHSEGASTYLRAGDTKRGITEMDSDGSHTDALTGQTDASSVKTDLIIPAKAPENVRTRRKKTKPPDLPMEAARAAPDEPDGRRNHMDRSGVHRDVHSIGNERETGANKTENVRTSQNDLKAPNSPYMREIATPKPADRWK